MKQREAKWKHSTIVQNRNCESLENSKFKNDEQSDSDSARCGRCVPHARPAWLEIGCTTSRALSLGHVLPVTVVPHFYAHSMKETIADPTLAPARTQSPETSSERKRRLARERQRRHRERIRSKNADPHAAKQNSPHTDAANPSADNPVSHVATTNPSAAAVAAAIHVTQHTSSPTAIMRVAQQRSGPVSTVVRNTDGHAAHVPRSDRQAAAVAGVITNIAQPVNERSSHSARDSDVHPAASVDRNQPPPNRKEKSTQHQLQERSTIPRHAMHGMQHEERHHHLQQQQQRQYNHNFLMHQHSSAFVSHSHGFASASQPQQSPRPHPSNESPMGFSSQTIGASSQPHFVTEAQHRYLQDHGMSLTMQNRTYLRHRQQHRTSQPSAVMVEAPQDTSVGLTALPTAVNGIHTALAAPTSSIPGPSPAGPSHPALSMTGTVAARFDNAVTAAAAAPGSVQMQQTGVRPTADGGTEAALDTYAHNPLETAEERKRRLARERQRRRRKRLKGETDGKATGMEGAERTSSEANRDPHTLNGGSLGMNSQGLQTHGQEAVGPTQFEGGLSGGHGMQGALQPVHVAVGATQEELASVATARGGFSAHQLGVGGSSGLGASSGIGVGLGQHMEIQQRIGSGSGDGNVGKDDGEDYSNENAEQRKRRLARDRQRRRRSRLKRSRLTAGLDKEGGGESAMKNVGETSAGRVMEGAGVSVGGELDRRAMGGEGITEGDRVAMGPPGGGVFSGRDVGQLGFGERGMRVVESVHGMGLNYGGNESGSGNGSVVNLNGVAGLMHWSQAFESESSARFHVESAVSAFRDQVANLRPDSRLYVLQHGILRLLGLDESCRDVLMSILRTDGSIIRM